MNDRIDSKTRIARSVQWIFWSRGAMQAVSFLSTLIVARLLAPSDYGQVALVGVWTVTLSMLSEMGIGSAIIQFRDLEEKELNACFWFVVGAVAAGYVLLFLAAPSIAKWFGSPGMVTVLRAGGLMPVLLMVLVVPDSLLKKRLQLDKVCQAEVMANLVSTPTVLTLAWWGAGVWALVAGCLIIPFVQTVASFRFSGWRPGLRVDGRRLGGLIRFGLATLGNRMCWTVYNQADAFVLGRLGGEGPLGLFSMAKQLALLPVNKFCSVVSMINFPVMAEIQGDLGAIQRALLRALRLVIWVLAPIAVAGGLLAEDLITLLLGSKWLPMVPIFQVLCLTAFALGIESLMAPVLLARRRTGFLLIYTVTLMVVLPVTFILGALWLGALGVALSWLIISPFSTTILIAATLRETELTWKEFGRQFWSPLTAVVLMATGIGLIQTAYPALHVSPITGAMLSLLAGTGIYLLVLLTCESKARKELAEVLCWVVQRPVRVGVANQ